MSLHKQLRYWYRLLHRYNPFRAEVGLRAIGNPGRQSPVLVSGNYEHTVEQLEEVLAGQDCWLLVADSAGINVWCAAGVGDFNENKITDAIVATGLSGKVEHRRLVLPPLAAVGIDRRRLRDDTGFSTIWGPAHLDDLPAFLADGCRRTPEMRPARFPWRDRWENAVGMMGVFAFPVALAWWWPRQVAWFLFSIAHAVFGTLLLYDRLPPKFPANKTALLGVVQALLICLRCGFNLRDRRVREKLFLGALAHLLIAIDMIGSTPFFKTTIARWLTTGDNRSLFQPALNGRCTSCGACIEVCPKGLFERDRRGEEPCPPAKGEGEPGRPSSNRAGGSTRKVQVRLERECCECLACARQCPANAIDNAGTGFKEDIRGLAWRPERR